MTRRIIQFGTSRFLQAHVDLFVHEARRSGDDIGPITVVKTSRARDRDNRISAFKRGMPYPVRIRGVAANRVIDETVEVTSVDSAFDAHDEWPAVVACFAQGAEIAVSNTGDSGFERSREDATHDYSSYTPPGSFPAKLLALLLARYRQSGRPMIFLPTELVSGNGRRLAETVSNLAEESRQPDQFRRWLARSVIFADTLVDRIVSEPIEPIGAVAEPYALWAIRNGGFGDVLRHPAVRMVDDLAPFERLKLHILNLGHTVLADIWAKKGRGADETVWAILEDPTVSRTLVAIYSAEVVPGFALYDMGAAAQDYVAATLERFRNPFLKHRLADIYQNHDVKLRNRIAAFLEWLRCRDPGFAAPRLTKML
jgi:tagaturonate reductase